MNKGKVVQIIGPAIDVQFDNGNLPAINNALEIKINGKESIIAEVAQQLGDNMVRAVALAPTDGLARGFETVDTGSPLKVPVGEACLGRLMNVLGRAQDHRGEIKTDNFASIHTPPPPLEEQVTTPQIFET
ncbi:MAG: F0F1 ATP synthase subunit beta, partial [Elusimicrobiota bacterium]|nr:F0F1 ATP synthase subunit beta [Elusimicrobiota bacterium]